MMIEERLMTKIKHVSYREIEAVDTIMFSMGFNKGRPINGICEICGEIHDTC